MKIRTAPWTVLVVFAMGTVGIRGAEGQGVEAAASPPAASSEIGLLAEDVAAFRQIGQLRLSAGQLRELTQILSPVDRATREYQDRQRAAAIPVAAALGRVRTALASGHTPEEADEAVVSAALAPLRPLASALEKQRRDAVKAILHTLTPAQLDMLRAAAGETAGMGGPRGADRSFQIGPIGPNAPNGAPGPAELQGGGFDPNPPNGVPAPADLQARQAQMQAIEGQRQELERQTAATMDTLQKQMQGVQAQLQKLEAENQQQNPGAPGQDPGAPAGGQPDPGRDPIRNLQQHVQDTQRQAQVAQQRAGLVQQASTLQVQMAQRYAQFAQQQAGMVQNMAQLQMQMIQIAGRGGATEAQAQNIASPDEGLVRELFLRPGVLGFLRARAGQ